MAGAEPTALLPVGEAGIPRARVVAVIAALPGGREQVGSGYLITGRLVLTAAHCTWDKATEQAPLALRVVRASDGASAEVTGVLPAPAADVAVLRLAAALWEEDLPAPVYARVNRDYSGVLTDCAAIGYPLFQRDPAARTWHTAELHGTIYQTDEAETGRLLLREPQLTSVTLQQPPEGSGAGGEASVWGGLSGALVFHASRALGVVVEHHPRQGSAAVQLVAFDWLRRRADTDADAQAVVDALTLPPLDRLGWAAAEPVAPLSGLVDALDPAAGDLPVVGDLDPYRLGATRSDFGDQDSYGRRDPYVPRTRDHLDDRLRHALAPGRLVVVVGASKVGKSRTAFEAVRACWPQARLAAPDPAALPALVGHPRVQASADPLVVWLDDLDRFLTGAHPLTPALLTRLTARPGPTVVVATLRREVRDRLRAATGELTRDTRSVLEAATTLELASTAEDPGEQAAAQAAYPDQPLGRAGLAEHLGYAPQLLQTYRDSAAADSLLHAVTRAAVDWSRTGVPRPLPEPDLVQIVGDLLWEEHPELDPTEETMTEAVRRARTPPGNTGTALLITASLPGRVRGYRAYDYLVAADDGQTGRPRPLPERSWGHALTRADPDDAFAVSESAYFRANIPISIQAAKQAAEDGHPGAAYILGVLLADESDEREPPDLPAARRWYEQAAEAGITIAMNSLAVLLATRWDPPDLLTARAWWERAAAGGHVGAAYNLGNMLANQWDPPDLPAARAWWERAAGVGHAGAMLNLGVLLADRWEPPDLPAARAWWERAAEAGHVGAAYNLGMLLADRWDPPELPAARGWYERAAAAGHTEAAYRLGFQLSDRCEPPDLPAARRWYERAAEAGHTSAAYNLGVLFASRCDPPDLPAARSWWEQAAASGHAGAMNSLGVLLTSRCEPPDLPAARRWYERAVATRHIDAAYNLGMLLASRWEPPDLPSARGWYERAAADGHAGAMVNLGVLLASRWEPPDLPAARTWWERAAEAGDTEAMVNLSILLATQWQPPDPAAALDWYRRAADAGHSGAKIGLKVLHGEGEEALELAADP